MKLKAVMNANVNCGNIQVKKKKPLSEIVLVVLHYTCIKK